MQQLVIHVSVTASVQHLFSYLEPLYLIVYFNCQEDRSRTGLPPSNSGTLRIWCIHQTALDPIQGPLLYGPKLSLAELLCSLTTPFMTAICNHLLKMRNTKANQNFQEKKNLYNMRCNCNCHCFCWNFLYNTVLAILPSNESVLISAYEKF